MDLEFDIDLRSRGAGWLEVQLRLSPQLIERCSVRAGIASAEHPDELQLSLPTWTPGSYLVREYARNLSAVRVVEPGDEHSTRPGDSARRLTKSSKNRFLVPIGPCERRLGVTLRYRVYARECSVRTAFATDDLVFWDGAVPYLWPAQTAEATTEVRVSLPEGWRLCAGGQILEPGPAAAAGFSVVDRATLIDTPCLASRCREWEFRVGGRRHVLAAAGLGGIEPPPGFVDDVRKVVATTAEVFGGELPFDQYVFHCLFGESGRGGLEHRDCSVLLAPRTTFESREEYEDFLGLVCHEYLHVWNVKRTRPVEFVTYDYESEVYSELLWVAEGCTAYYDELCLRRAGAIDAERYLRYLVRDIRNLEDNPGRFEQSLAEASRDAWIRLYRADENTRNTTQNYYGNGAVVAFCLDAEIRRASGGVRCLDHALRLLHERVWVAGGDRAGYHESDVVACLCAAADADLGPMIHAAVHGTPPQLDLDRALSLFGLRLRRGDAEPVPYLGIQLGDDGTRFAAVRAGGPTASAGLRAGDEWLALDGHRVTPANWRELRRALCRAGRPSTWLVSRDGLVFERVVVPGRPATFPSRIETVPEPTESQLAHRESWLGCRSLLAH